eukprot:TRINITY_DN32415_c0_g1_i1.p1 TRINITY_DN32415_c0_g1~~TRINITY_DN32415_c0_g1_i1.p1  ORF type:complete len:1643 (+),score=597.03 TRINITY_DN32415_c0_g1_i1:48-4976(+)
MPWYSCLPGECVALCEGAKTGYAWVADELEKGSGGVGIDELEYLLRCLLALQKAKIAPNVEDRKRCIRVLLKWVLDPAIRRLYYLLTGCLVLTYALLRTVTPNGKLWLHDFSIRVDDFLDLADALYVLKSGDHTHLPRDLTMLYSKVLKALSNYWENPETVTQRVMDKYTAMLSTKQQTSAWTLLRAFIPIRYMTQAQFDTLHKLTDVHHRVWQLNIHARLLKMHLIAGNSHAGDLPPPPLATITPEAVYDLVARLQAFPCTPAQKRTVAQVIAYAGGMEFKRSMAQHGTSATPGLEDIIQRVKDSMRALICREVLKLTWQLRTTEKDEDEASDDESDAGAGQDELDSDDEGQDDKRELAEFGRRFARIMLRPLTTSMLTSLAKHSQTTNRVLEAVLKLDLSLLPEVLEVARISGSKTTGTSKNFPFLLRTLTPFIMDAGSDAEKAWLLGAVLEFLDPCLQYALSPAGDCVGYIAITGALIRGPHYDPQPAGGAPAEGSAADAAAPCDAAAAPSAAKGAAYDPVKWGEDCFERYIRLCEKCAFSIDEHMLSVEMLLFTLPEDAIARCCARVAHLIDTTVHGSTDISDAILENTSSLAQMCAKADLAWGTKVTLALMKKLRDELGEQEDEEAQQESSIRWTAGLLSSLTVACARELVALEGAPYFLSLAKIARRFVAMKGEWQRNAGAVMFGAAVECLVWMVLRYWKYYVPPHAHRKAFLTPFVSAKHVAPEWVSYEPEHVAVAEKVLVEVLEECYHGIVAKEAAGAITDAECTLFECVAMCYTEVLPHETTERDDAFLSKLVDWNGIAHLTKITRADLVALASRLTKAAGSSDIANQAVVKAAGELVDSGCLAFMAPREVAVLSRLARMSQVRFGQRRVSTYLFVHKAVMSYFNVIVNAAFITRRLPADEQALALDLVPLAAKGLKDTVKMTAHILSEYVQLPDARPTAIVNAACRIIQNEHQEALKKESEDGGGRVNTRTLKGILHLLTGNQRMLVRCWDSADTAALGSYVLVHAGERAEKDVKVMFDSLATTLYVARSEYSQHIADDFTAAHVEPLLQPRLTPRVVERVAVPVFGVLMEPRQHRQLASPAVVTYLIQAFAYPQKSVRIKSAYALHNILFARGGDWTEAEKAALDAACSTTWLTDVFAIDHETENLARPDAKAEQKPFYDHWRARVWKLLFKVLGQALFDRVLSLELVLSESNCVGVFEMVSAIWKAERHVALAGSEAYVTALVEAVQASNLNRMCLELREAMAYGASGMVKAFTPDAPHYATALLYAWWRRAYYSHIQKRVLSVISRYVLGVKRNPDGMAALLDAVDVVLSTSALPDYESVRTPLATFLSTAINKAYWTSAHEQVCQRVLAYADAESQGKQLILAISSDAFEPYMCPGSRKSGFNEHPSFAPFVEKCLESATVLITERKQFQNEGSDTETLVTHAIRWVGSWFPERLHTLLVAASRVEKSRLYQRKGAHYLNTMFAAAAKCQGELQKPEVYALVHTLLWDNLRCNIESAAQDAAAHTEKIFGALAEAQRAALVAGFLEKLKSDDVKERKGAARGLSGVLAHRPLVPTDHTWNILTALLPVALHDASHEVKKRSADAVVGWRQVVVERPLVWRFLHPEVERRGLLHDLMHLRSSRYSNAFS